MPSRENAVRDALRESFNRLGSIGRWKPADPDKIDRSTSDRRPVIEATLVPLRNQSFGQMISRKTINQLLIQ